MFHWETEFSLPAWKWPQPAAYYALCRHAIASLCAMQAERPRLWLPTFFCPEVARSCRPLAEIHEYRDDCRWTEPDWESLRPAENDLVLAVNYFGVRRPEPWQRWRARRECILVEDHTQDPFSAWALGSVADYAVCSIRKTVPVPDGAILWSPAGGPLPPPTSDSNDFRGSMLKAGAMLYKRLYLSGSVGEGIKPRFRKLQLEGEQELGRQDSLAMSPLARAIVLRGVPKVWRQQRMENARTLLEVLEHWEVAKPAFQDWPEGHAPFDIALVFGNREQRDHYQISLQREDIYCPVEWVCDTADRNAMDLSSRILNVPIDHRYGREDMKKIAAAILAVKAMRTTAVAV
jgi:hypothetical protein